MNRDYCYKPVDTYERSDNYTLSDLKRLELARIEREERKKRTYIKN